MTITNYVTTMERARRSRRAKKPRANDTLCILDWDDTLFPTTAWSRANHDDSATMNQFAQLFAHLDTIVTAFLTHALSLGRVAIVTNATTGWVDVSSQHYPKASALLACVPVVSARTRHQNSTHEPAKWKEYTFDEITTRYAPLSNIISIGDAEYEREALIAIGHASASVKRKCYLKTIRLVTEPDGNTVLEQLTHLDKVANKIWTKQSHLDLEFSA